MREKMHLVSFLNMIWVQFSMRHAFGLLLEQKRNVILNGSIFFGLCIKWEKDACNYQWM